MFPGARFVHITRDPETLFASTRRLWPSLDSAQGLQYPKNEHLDEYIFECFERMYRGFESQRECLDADQICDVRYEDLVQRPIDELQRIYGHLKIEGFADFRPELEAFVGKQRDYKPNQHPDLEPEIRRQLRQRWAGYYEKYGYADAPQLPAEDAASV
jgi:hypothetical protein